MSRDVKAPLYRAEQNLQAMLNRSEEAPTIQIHGSTITLPVERKFGDIDGVQRYVDQVLALNWVQEKYPRAKQPITVRVRKGSAFAHYEPGNVIAIPIQQRASQQSWAMRELVVLHEVAHHLAGASHGHDGTFASALLFLLDGLIGSEAAWVLGALLHEEEAAIS